MKEQSMYKYVKIMHDSMINPLMTSAYLTLCYQLMHIEKWDIYLMNKTNKASNKKKN